MRTLRRISPALLAFLVLGCGKKEEEAPRMDSPTTMAPPMARVVAVDLGRHLGANRRVSDTTSTFTPRDTFFVSVAIEHPGPQSTLGAKWTFQDGQVIDSTSQPVAATSAAEPISVTEFHVSKPGGWPAGSYTVEVFLDGASHARRTFEVRR